MKARYRAVHRFAGLCCRRILPEAGFGLCSTSWKRLSCRPFCASVSFSDGISVTWICSFSSAVASAVLTLSSAAPTSAMRLSVCGSWSRLSANDIISMKAMGITNNTVQTVQVAAEQFEFFEERGSCHCGFCLSVAGSSLRRKSR